MAKLQRWASYVPGVFALGFLAVAGVAFFAFLLCNSIREAVLHDD